MESISRSALASGQQQQLWIDLDSQKYWITQDAASLQPGEEPEEANLIPEQLWLYQMITAAGRFTSGTVSLNFFPDGTRDFALLHLREVNTDKFYTIFLNPCSPSIRLLAREIYYDETL
ncbi:MAG TPA: hypothetical protein PKX93_09420 [bacterium]|nr:hypothetical protein [bacterium]